MAGRKLTTLTLKRKIELIDEVEKKAKKQKDVALQFGIPPNTVSTIMKKRDHYRDMFYSGQTDTNKQRQRTSQHDDIEKKLLAWFTDMRASNVPINGPILKTKAEELAGDLNKCDWTCSDSWISRFKKRHNIVFKSVCGESQAVDDTTVDDWRKTVLADLLSKYSPSDIYNADETGLFWRLLPDKTMEFKGTSCHGGKQAKERVTVLCCANMDGSEKWPLFVIGKFKQPRCFKGLRRLPVSYDANKSAWMTSTIFDTWLRDFDRTMALRGRKVVMVVDNCAAHPHVQNLISTELVFLPPNVTAKLQPCDMGIINNLKTFYRSSLLKRLVQHVDGGASFEDFKPTLLDAIILLKTAWGKIEPATIINCFRKAGFSAVADPPIAPSASRSDEQLVGSEIEPLLSRLYAESESIIEASDFVSVDEDVMTSPLLTQTVSNEELSEDAEQDDLGPALPDVNFEMVTSSLQNISAYIMQRGCSDEFSTTLLKLESMLEKHHQTAKVQSKISDFFCKK